MQGIYHIFGKEHYRKSPRYIFALDLRHHVLTSKLALYRKHCSSWVRQFVLR